MTENRTTAKTATHANEPPPAPTTTQRQIPKSIPIIIEPPSDSSTCNVASTTIPLVELSAGDEKIVNSKANLPEAEAETPTKSKDHAA